VPVIFLIQGAGVGVENTGCDSVGVSVGVSVGSSGVAVSVGVAVGGVGGVTVGDGVGVTVAVGDGVNVAVEVGVGNGVALMISVGVADTSERGVRVGGTNWVGNSPSVGVGPVLVKVARTRKVGVICDGVGVARSRGAIPSATKPMM
jgi:hypothetical protein